MDSGVVLVSAEHILSKVSRRGSLHFSWNEAVLALSHLCVCVSPIHFVITGLICVTAGGQGSGCGRGTVLLSLSQLGPHVSTSHSSDPISFVLSPPGLHVPDGLNSGRCFWYLLRVEDLGCSCL